MYGIIDFHIFQDGYCTTNQWTILEGLYLIWLRHPWFQRSKVRDLLSKDQLFVGASEVVFERQGSSGGRAGGVIIEWAADMKHMIYSY